jgi:hypothetical protein
MVCGWICGKTDAGVLAEYAELLRGFVSIAAWVALGGRDPDAAAAHALPRRPAAARKRLSARLYGMAEAMPLHFSVPEVSFSARCGGCAPSRVFSVASAVFPAQGKSGRWRAIPGLKIETRASLPGWWGVTCQLSLGFWLVSDLECGGITLVGWCGG